MPPELVKLMIVEVDVAVPAGPGVEAGMVLLQEVDEPRRRLRIVIGKAEARAIHASWTGVVPTRPSTWDLYVSSVALLEARVDRAVITAVEEDRHFFANIEVERAGERRVLACRPSDAIAIAMRAYGAEITCVPEVVDTAGLREDGTRFGPWTWPEQPEPEQPEGSDEPDDGSPAADEGPVGGTIGAAPEGTLQGDVAQTMPPGGRAGAGPAGAGMADAVAAARAAVVASEAALRAVEEAAERSPGPGGGLPGGGPQE